MSPRAAWRLEALGFENVYDYVPGKADWLGHGLPVEGENADVARAGRIVRDDVVTARLGDRIGDVRQAVERSPYRFALVASEGGTLLGRLRRATLDADPAARAEELMEPGPTTTRPDTRLDALAERMKRHDLETFVISTPEGKLLGVVSRTDVESGAR